MGAQLALRGLRFRRKPLRKILVADDDPALRSLLRIVAKRAGFAVATASNGVEALEQLQQEAFEIAIIDLMMPRLSGYELLGHIASMPNRPVVVVVTAMNDAHLQRLDGTLVTSIFRKPFDIEMLSAALLEIAENIAENQSDAAPARPENVRDIRRRT